MTVTHSKILTVTVHSALDQTLEVKESYSEGDYQKVKEWFSAGGKGLNVSRALKHLGSPALGLTLLGGSTGKKIREELDREKLNVISSAQKSDTRIQLSITQEKGFVLHRVLDSGSKVSVKERECFEKKFEALLKKVNIVVLSGSLLPGFSSSWYAQWIRKSHSANVLVFLDTRGVFFKNALKAQPQWIKPNQEEAEEFLGRRIRTDKNIKKALKEFHKIGVVNPFVSLGENGLAGWIDGECYRSVLVNSEKNTSHYSVGCGDSCVAGLMDSFIRKRNPEDTMRWATACGTDNLRTPIPGQISKRLVEKNLKHVKVWRV